GANLVALGEVLVAPDVDDLGELPDLGMPESGELGILLPLFVGFAEALFDRVYRRRLDRGGPDLVEHGASSCCETGGMGGAAESRAGQCSAKRGVWPVPTL